MTTLREADGLTAADVMHARLTTLPASATVGEVRDYFAGSGSRRLALLVDGERYVGSIEAAELSETADAGEPASAHALRGPTVGPRTPAGEASEMAVQLPVRRVVVVGDDGALLGIVAVDKTLTKFCGA